MAKQKLSVEGVIISVNDKGYISLTDIAKKSSKREPDSLLQSWLRNQDTLLFLATWEQLHNPNFKPSQMAGFRIAALENRNVIGVQNYIKETNAIGVISTSGRYGGTYAHSDIALNFCYWLSPEFQVYLLKEFQRLKDDEARRLGLEFDLRREIVKANYPIHTEAIKTHLLGEGDSSSKVSLVYANEADLLNIVVFGCTAKRWKEQNPDKQGNIRDYASIEELMVLANVEFLNAKLIAWDCDKDQRLQLLQETVREQIKIYHTSAAVQRIKDKANSLK